MSEQLFQVARRVSTPLSLASVVVLLLYGIYKLVLENKLIPQLSQDSGFQILVRIVNYLFILALIALVLGIASFVYVKFLESRSPSIVTMVDQEERTNDEQIDEFMRELKRSKETNGQVSQADLEAAIGLLFRRSAFYPNAEQGNWEAFLYVLWKTRKIIEGCIGIFEPGDRRTKLSTVVQLMDGLQLEVSKGVFNNASFIASQLSQYLNNRSKFIMHVPDPIKDNEDQMNDKRQNTIRKIREILEEINLV